LVEILAVMQRICLKNPNQIDPDFPQFEIFSNILLSINQ
jgi:hypothetical protein